MTTSDVESVLEQVKSEGKLPLQVTGRTYDEMVKSLTRYFNKIGAQKISEVADEAATIVEDILKTEQSFVPEQGFQTTVGEGMSTARARLVEFIESMGAESISETMNLDFFLRVAEEVSAGAGQHMAQNFDQDRVDEYPALELVRVYERDVPRGSEKDPAGPENGWDDDSGRWVAACEEAGDADAQKVFEETGRMVALKSSGVWQALGGGAGGYDDTLGNPFEPFAFNSGYGTEEIDAEEAIELGLLSEGEEAEPAKLDFEDLLAIPK